MAQIIAEFCQNHNGDFELLKEMIHAAKEAGATYGKIQAIFANDLTFRKRFEEGMVENGIVKCIKENVVTAAIPAAIKTLSLLSICRIHINEYNLLINILFLS